MGADPTSIGWSCDQVQSHQCSAVEHQELQAKQIFINTQVMISEDIMNKPSLHLAHKFDIIFQEI